jgi:alkylhydroperoxidase family enzyme
VSTTPALTHPRVADSSHSTSPRLEPIELPPSRFAAFAYRRAAHQLGAVPTPLKVTYARKPVLLLALQLMDRIATKHLTLDPQLRLLVQNHVSALSGAAFCIDLRRSMAVRVGISAERLEGLTTHRTSPLFTPAERAALTYVEAVVNRTVDDDVFADVRAHFTDTQLVELTWLAAHETYHNLTNRALDIGSDGLESKEGVGPRG